MKRGGGFTFSSSNITIVATTIVQSHVFVHSDDVLFLHFFGPSGTDR